MNEAPLAGDDENVDLHQGDWEHVDVLLDPRTHAPLWLYLARHSYEGQFIPWNSPQIQFDQGHPLLQAAFGGHPTYLAGLRRATAAGHLRPVERLAVVRVGSVRVPRGRRRRSSTWPTTRRRGRAGRATSARPRRSSRSRPPTSRERARLGQALRVRRRSARRRCSRPRTLACVRRPGPRSGRRSARRSLPAIAGTSLAPDRGGRIHPAWHRTRHSTREEPPSVK